MTMNSEPTFPIPLKYDVRNGVQRYRYFSTWWANGKRHGKSFGIDGETTKKQVKRDYEAWLMEWRERPDLRDPGGQQAAITVTRVAARYLRHAGRTYIKHGKRTSHVGNIKYAARAMRNLIGGKIATAVEAPDIALLRDTMIHGDAGPRSMKTVNTRLRIVKDAFVWAREKGWISERALADILSVKRLRKNRSAAKNSKKIKGISDLVVTETLKHLPAILQDMIAIERLTGMRPGEVCIVRGCDLVVDQQEGVWFYRPHIYKLEHMENAAERIIVFGPLAQAILQKYLRTDLTAYLFSPAEAHAQRLEKRRTDRETKLWPSHAKKRKENPTARLGAVYSEQSFRKAIHHACKKAGIKPWNPNQLRHAAANRLERQYGLDGTRVVLGHGHTSTTLIYLDPDVQKAVKIAREVG